MTEILAVSQNNPPTAAQAKTRSGNSYSERAASAYRAGDYLESLRAAESALRADRSDIRAFFFKGKALSKLGRRAEAVSFMEMNLPRVLSANGENPELPVHTSMICDLLAVSYMELGNWERARGWAERAVEADPSNQVARYNLGVVFMKHGGPDWKYFYSMSIPHFRMVDPALLLEQRAEISDSQASVLALGRELPARLGTGPRDLENVASAILSYPRERVPEATNAYLQYFIRYVPDAVDNDEIAPPEEFVSKGWGDCDDYAAFASYIFGRAGIESETDLQYSLNGPHHMAIKFTLNGSEGIIDQNGIRY